MLDILVADDEEGIRGGLAWLLSEEGHRVAAAADGAEALALVGAKRFDLIISDIRLPKLDGLSLFRHVRRRAPDTAVVLMTAYASVSGAVAAVREGAYDYVTKPFDVERFVKQVVGPIAERRALDQEIETARVANLTRSGQPFIGRSPAMRQLLERVEILAKSDAPVVITGESGTGKELVARALHAGSSRRQRPFVAVNCAAVPEALVEAELFGHERGAFTGAAKRREGRFQAAHGGTLLLDEIAELPLAAQAKILRVLQEGSVQPLGSDVSVTVDVRIVAATHRDLRTRVAEGTFREDLYFRLNVLDVSVPPLRERKEDLPLLYAHFLARFTPPGHEPPRIAPRAWRRLCEHSFPGNVRELAHVVERAVTLACGGTIDLPHLPRDLVDPAPAAGADRESVQPLSSVMRECERAYLVRALRLTGGKRGRAAELLGISRKSLWQKLRSHGIADEGDGETGGSEEPCGGASDD